MVNPRESTKSVMNNNSSSSGFLVRVRNSLPCHGNGDFPWESATSVALRCHGNRDFPWESTKSVVNNQRVPPSVAMATGLPLGKYHNNGLLPKLPWQQGLPLGKYQARVKSQGNYLIPTVLPW